MKIAHVLSYLKIIPYNYLHSYGKNLRIFHLGLDKSKNSIIQ